MDQQLFKTATHSWVGECQMDATHVAEVPSSEDSRWIPGRPEILDTEVLTLSPFYPSGRLGVCVEKKLSKPFSTNTNHPSFGGCKAWMQMGNIPWQEITQ